MQVLEETCSKAQCRASTTSSADVDEELASTADDGPPTLTSLAGHRHARGPPTSPSSVSSRRPTASPSTASSHSRCSCSRRVTDIRAFSSGFHSDGDVDDAVAMESRRRLQRSLRSTTSEGGGAFRRVLPAPRQRAYSNGSIGYQPAASAPTPRDRDVTGRAREWMRGAETRRNGYDGDCRSWACESRHRGRDSGDCIAGQVVDDAQNGRNGAGQGRRRGRQVLSVVKSGAGLRAISETGDTCRRAAASASLAADVSHPVIRGLYRPHAPVPESSSLASSPSSSSSSSSSSASARAARRPCDRTAFDDFSSDDSQQSSV